MPGGAIWYGDFSPETETKVRHCRHVCTVHAPCKLNDRAVTTALLHFHVLRIALILLLSARNGVAVVYAHTIEKFFLKVRFDRSYVTALGAGGGLIHKYVRCSGEYYLLFRDVRPPVYAHVLYANVNGNIRLTAMGVSMDYMVAGVYAEELKLRLVFEGTDCTSQQRVKHG